MSGGMAGEEGQPFPLCRYFLCRYFFLTCAPFAVHNPPRSYRSAVDQRLLTTFIRSLLESIVFQCGPKPVRKTRDALGNRTGQWPSDRAEYTIVCGCSPVSGGKLLSQGEDGTYGIFL